MCKGWESHQYISSSHSHLFQTTCFWHLPVLCTPQFSEELAGIMNKEAHMKVLSSHSWQMMLAKHKMTKEWRAQAKSIVDHEDMISTLLSVQFYHHLVGETLTLLSFCQNWFCMSPPHIPFTFISEFHMKEIFSRALSLACNVCRPTIPSFFAGTKVLDNSKHVMKVWER